jgi:acyl carrier protein
MTPTQSKVVRHLLAIFEAKGKPAPPIDEHSPVDGSLGLESLDFAELAIRLEDEFGRDPFAEDEIPPLRTVADLAALYD